MKKFKGVYTAIITPFDSHNQLDEEGLLQNIQYQIEGNVDGIVPLGTTGEAPTLSKEEKIKIIKMCVEEAKGIMPVIVGTGSYSTNETIERTKEAKDLGADAVLVVTPYYNKPTQEGLFQHFKALTDQVDIPVIVYNIQGRTGQNIQTDTLKRIAELPNIVGVKEASGQVSQMSDVIEMVARNYPHFSVLSGDDGLTLPLMSLGGDGVISVISNLFPKEVKALVTAHYEEATNLHFSLMPFIRAAFIETNPIPIKAAMKIAGLPSGDCRLPLCDLQPQNYEHLKRVLTYYGKAKSPSCQT
jgi:4-hydroxy-tetrahydrodipicolinate synthase